MAGNAGTIIKGADPIRWFAVLFSACCLIFLSGCGGSSTPTQTQTESTVPSAPTVIYPTEGDGQVTITWNAVSGATSYNLYMTSQYDVNKSNYATLPDGMKHENVTSPYTHTGLTNGKTYYFVLTAVNGAGESGESLGISATLLGTAVETGKVVYEKNKCGICHGEDAKGTNMGPSLLESTIDDKFVNAIIEGKGSKMPAYKSKLNGNDLGNLLAFIGSLE